MVAADARGSGAVSAGIGAAYDFYVTDINFQKQIGRFAAQTTVWGGSPSADLFFSTVNNGTLSERLRISAAGNVGIGSSVPQAKLDVEGSAYFGNGNIGIGTSAPRQKLEISGGAILGAEVAPSVSATIAVDWSSSNQQYITLSQVGHTVNFSNFAPGQTLRLVVCQNNPGGQTITTWGGATFVWSGGSAPALTSGNSKCDILTFMCTDAKGSTQIFGSSVLNF
jgi:hypothetical protein